jgi:hypothetical protein
LVAQDVERRKVCYDLFMTDHDLNLEGAYALKTPQDTKRLYAAWADTYDDYFSDAQGYLIPREVVRVYTGAGGRGRRFQWVDGTL